MLKQKVLILGVSSFAGYSFYNYIKSKKFKVYGTYNKNINIGHINKSKIKLSKIDLEKDNNKLILLVKKIKPEFIIDFASICMVNESWQNPKKYFKINFLSKINLCKFVSDKKFLKKYIYISTPEVFGSTNKYLSEDLFEYKPSTPYASSKLAAENIIKNFNNKNKFVIARFSNFYGPYQPNYRLIPNVILSILNKKNFIIQGKGSSKRNFIFSDDFCEGILKVILKKNHRFIYHFSGEEFYSVKQIVMKISTLMGKKFSELVKYSKDRKGKDKIYKLKSFKTKKNLNWRPKINIDDGIKKIINYIEKNKIIVDKRPNNFKL